MNKFEVVLLISPDIAKPKIDEEINKFKEIIKSSSGKIVNEEDWGLRDLNFNILKFKKAFYKFFQIEILGSEISNIKKDLTQNDNFIRHLFIKVNKHQDLPTKIANEKK